MEGKRTHSFLSSDTLGTLNAAHFEMLGSADNQTGSPLSAQRTGLGEVPPPQDKTGKQVKEVESEADDDDDDGQGLAVGDEAR